MLLRLAPVPTCGVSFAFRPTSDSHARRYVRPPTRTIPRICRRVGSGNLGQASTTRSKPGSIGGQGAEGAPDSAPPGSGRFSEAVVSQGVTESSSSLFASTESKSSSLMDLGRSCKVSEPQPVTAPFVFVRAWGGRCRAGCGVSQSCFALALLGDGSHNGLRRPSSHVPLCRVEFRSTGWWWPHCFSRRRPGGSMSRVPAGKGVSSDRALGNQGPGSHKE